MLLLRFQQGVPDAGQLTFIAEESEDGRNQQHRLPQDELRSFPMIKQRHRRQCADKKETDLANTEQYMTQYNAMTKPGFRAEDGERTNKQSASILDQTQP